MLSPETIAAIVTAVTSVVAIGLAVYSFRVQTRVAITALGITMLREYEKDFFYSEQVRTIRYRTALFLINRKPGELPPNEAFDLLDFFDCIGFHLKRKVLDPEMTWTYFYYWVSHYWPALEQDVANFTAKQNGVFYHANCLVLYKALNKYGRDKDLIPTNYIGAANNGLHEFLEEEIASCGTPLSIGFDRLMPN